MDKSMQVGRFLADIVALAASGMAVLVSAPSSGARFLGMVGILASACQVFDPAGWSRRESVAISLLVLFPGLAFFFVWGGMLGGFGATMIAAGLALFLLALKTDK